EALFIRTGPDGKEYGADELDILYWFRTKHFLEGTSHKKALAILDEFIDKHGEKLIHDPLKRALLQRDLWALFDWAAVPFAYYQAKFPETRHDLESRLAVVIQRLELTTNEIASLPDNYALAEKKHLPDLPQGLFDTNSDWISVGVQNAEMTVPTHVRGFGGRSVFTVWFHDADGRQAGLDYLKRLRSFAPMFIFTTNRDSAIEPSLNPHLPEFPAHSQWALVRQMCVIGLNGRIQPTRVLETIQMRNYWKIGKSTTHVFTNEDGTLWVAGVPPQRFYEFRMSRGAQASLVSVPQNGREFTSNNQFFSKGIDPFEYHFSGQTTDPAKSRSIVLKTCAQCHNGPGIYSVNSFTRFLSLPGLTFQTTQMVEANPKNEEEAALNWKQRQFNWGLLQGLWIRASQSGMAK
ncbi:MAG TPA: hypothetical protein VKA67_11815, partial [Verrucomicrobiae bacterium]|nr:hypothetical protein [Verrucomicrobiae bacterium]